MTWLRDMLTKLLGIGRRVPDPMLDAARRRWSQAERRLRVVENQVVDGYREAADVQRERQ